MGKHRQQDELSQDQSEQQNQQQKVQIRKPKIERIDKFKSLKKIVINISMTQYPVISEVSEDLNWKIQSSNEAGDWDVYWTDFAIDPDILIKMHLFQKINHFPGMHVIARKNLLGMNLMSLRNKFPQQYNFFPLTWMLPMQYAEFRAYYQTKPKGKARTYIAKPEAQCQGRGIFLTRKIQDLQNGKHYVVQRYLARPFLLEGLKFDLRIYVLLCGTNPLRLYMYKQGLARLATEPYSEPNTFNLERQYIHLTNYAINKNNPKFIFNNNSNNMGIGHKRSITCVFKQLGAMGVNIQQLKQKINDVAIKTLICGLPHMSHQYKCSQPQDYAGNMCFHILGLDIMLNNKGQPILLQVNHTPSFTTDTPLDHKIKFNLIKDTLVLMNINVKSKNELYNRTKEINKQRLISGKRHIYQGQQREKAINEAQALRDQYQDKNLGGFQRIFPLKNQQKMKKYNQIIEVANKTYFQQNGSVRFKQLEKQAKNLTKSQNKQKNDHKISQSQKVIKQNNNLSLNSHNPENKGIVETQNKILNEKLNLQIEKRDLIVEVQDLTQSQNNIQRRNKLQNTLQHVVPHLIKKYSEKHKKIAIEVIQKVQHLQSTDFGTKPIQMRKSSSIHKVNTKKQIRDKFDIQLSSIQKQRMKSVIVGHRYNKKNPIHQNVKDFPNLAEQITSKKFNIEGNNSQIVTSQSIKKDEKQNTIRNHINSKNRANKIYQCISRQIQYTDKKNVTNGNFIMPKIININLDNQIRYLQPPNSFHPIKRINQ